MAGLMGSEGQSVGAVGIVEPGSYTLCVVPASVYPQGTLYGGLTVACVEVTTSDTGQFSLEVWESAVEGSYDVLVLREEPEGQRIIAGDDLGSGIGLHVDMVLNVPLTRWPQTVVLLGLLCVASLWSARARRERLATSSPREGGSEDSW